MEEQQRLPECGGLCAVLNVSQCIHREIIIEVIAYVKYSTCTILS